MYPVKRDNDYVIKIFYDDFWDTNCFSGVSINHPDWLKIKLYAHIFHSLFMYVPFYAIRTSQIDATIFIPMTSMII